VFVKGKIVVDKRSEHAIMHLQEEDYPMRESNVLDVIGMFCSVCFYIVAPIGCVVGVMVIILDLLGLI